MLISVYFALVLFFYFLFSLVFHVVAVCRDDKSNSFRSWLTWRMRNVSQLKLMGTARQPPGGVALISAHNERPDRVASMPTN